MPKRQRETHFEEITPALGKRVMKEERMKTIKQKAPNVSYFLGFGFLLFLVFILIFNGE